MTVTSLCLLAALCCQLMDRSRFMNAVRLVLGLEITWVMISTLDKLWQNLN